MHPKSLPVTLKLVLGYLIAFGVLGLVWPLLGLAPEHPEFVAQTFSYKVGAYFGQAAVAAGYVISAFALIYRRPWAIGLTYVVLAISAFQSAKAMAWGFSGGRPSDFVYGSALALTFAWHGLLAFIVHLNRQALRPTTSPHSA